jgi:hypothetical protein
MTCLCKDGKVSVYCLQTRAKGYKNGDWFYASLDHFGHPEGFNASGECWQKTSIFGVFDLDLAMKGLKQICEKNPGEEFRLVNLRVMQHTREVAIMKLPKSTKKGK